MEKRLIPYSVHLPEHIFLKVKEFAGDRRAASLIRDAIVAMVEGNDFYTKGYNSALEAAVKKIEKNKVATSVAINGELVAESIAREINQLRK